LRHRGELDAGCLQLSNSTGHGGACGGNGDTNSVVVSGTAYGSGTQASPGTLTDGGGDGTAFLRLNTPGPGNIADLVWRFVKTAEDPGANHTPGGIYAYRNAGPGPNANHGDLQCAAAETPVLTVGSTTLNLTYWERHQMEKGWDGVAIEYSRNGGPWTDVPAPSNAAGDGCMISDITADYATLECTDNPPINACGYPATKPVITGPSLLPVGDCTTYMTAELTAYGRRCHRLTGLAVGDTIQFRWRFTSDPATTFKGFYLDDIGVSNIRLPSACATAVPGVPVLTEAASRKSHGPAGPFDAPMSLNGSGVEPRNSSGDHTVVLKFNTPMQSGNATVPPGEGNVDSVSFSGNDMLVTLSGVADKQRVTITATNLTAVSGRVLSSVSLTVGFLAGDTTGDARVNVTDTGETKSNSGSLTNGNNFRTDANLDRRINVGDTNFVKSHSGNSLPAQRQPASRKSRGVNGTAEPG